MFAIFAIFAKYAILAKITTLKGTLAIFLAPFFLEQHYAAGGIMAFP